jgi:hypothetical protein
MAFLIAQALNSYKCKFETTYLLFSNFTICSYNVVGVFMREPIIITSDDPILESLNFKPHRNTDRRRVVPFAPADNEPQTMEVVTPWGARLIAKKGDMLVSEVEAPEDIWPVDADIFDKSYIIVGGGYCIKSAVTMLVPLTDLTVGDEDQLVTVQALEGPETVRAGDFYLAKGVKGEIWPYPKHKAAEVKSPVE